MVNAEHTEVLVAIGPDQRGIAFGFLGIVTDAGCNIEELRMQTLGGLFAVTMRLAGEESSFDSLRERASSWSRSKGYSVQFFPDNGGSGFPVGGRFKVRVYDVPDSEGLVHSIAQVLMKFDVNFQSIVGDRFSSPHTGEPLYTVDFDVNMELRRLPELEVHLKEMQFDYVIRPETL